MKYLPNSPQNLQNSAQTIGDYAYQAFAKHFRKTLKYESDVLDDRDPEALHQMRVGMRRLRSAATGFAAVVALPKAAREDKIGQIARTLGELRDFDVLLEALENRYLPKLPGKEQKVLKSAIATLSKQRQRTLKHVRQALEGKQYHKFTESLESWLKEPQYRGNAQFPAREVLPDLLFPVVSGFFLHPGWWVGSSLSPLAIAPDTIRDLLSREGESLHSLRKQAKRVRYQFELFGDFYGAAFEGYLQDIKDMQEILGQIQDGSVLQEVLTGVLDAAVADQLPTLEEQLTRAAVEAWQSWYLLRQRYNNVQTRQALYSTLLQPEAPDSQNGGQTKPDQNWVSSSLTNGTQSSKD